MPAYDASQKFGWDEKLKVSLCLTCRHKRLGKVCDAFPTGIPQDFLDGTREHRAPEPGDHGIQYEPR